MALTKSDLKQIKRFINDAVEELAQLVSKGFTDVYKRFDQNDAAHRQMNARLDLIERDLSDLKKEVTAIRRQLETVITRDEFEAALVRLSRVEKELHLTDS